MHCKSYSHFFSKKFQHICVSLDVNFNESLTNDFVSFEQLGPVVTSQYKIMLFAVPSNVHHICTPVLDGSALASTNAKDFILKFYEVVLSKTFVGFSS